LAKHKEVQNLLRMTHLLLFLGGAVHTQQGCIRVYYRKIKQYQQ